MSSFEQEGIRLDPALAETENRKQEHLDICRTQDVTSTSGAGWDHIRLPHCALPEIDFATVNADTSFLGHSFSAPILISSMTGGSTEGELINARLARFAENARLPMGVGSQRVALENREKKFFNLRVVAPKATLFANIGLVQLNYGVKVDDLKWLIDNLEAQALILHANVLQESIQSEGNRSFVGLLKKIETLRAEIKIPLILKETGCGLDVNSGLAALRAGIDVLDIAGMGGTHWGFIEGLRSPDRKLLGEIFRDWGIPAADALKEMRMAAPSALIIASGGLRNGLDAARALYLGADFTGMALPFLKNITSLENFFQLQLEAFRTALFCMGLQSTQELRNYGTTRK